jgi:hypothetical protein
MWEKRRQVGKLTAITDKSWCRETGDPAWEAYAVLAITGRMRRERGGLSPEIWT